MAESARNWVEGMLDRDNRTAKLRCCPNSRTHLVTARTCCYCNEDMSAIPTNTSRAVVRLHHRTGAITHIGNGVPGRASPHSSCKTRKSSRIWNTTLDNSNQAFVLVLYLALFSFPAIFAKPVSPHMIRAARMNSTPKWVNPCGIHRPSSTNESASIVQISDSALLSQVVNQANIALSKAIKFKEEFVQKTFNSNYEKIHNKFKGYHYDWLPSQEEVPKGLGEDVPQDHLEKLELNTTLLTTYEQLQKVAVGLEQIVWDQHDQHEVFEKHFTEAEQNLKLLLCELQMIVIEHDLTTHPDITRDIMTEEFRNMDNTSTHIRNWLVYRDYMNMLEYIIEVFNYLKTKL